MMYTMRKVWYNRTMTNTLIAIFVKTDLALKGFVSAFIITNPS
jgi:hypothetical protein